MTDTPARRFVQAFASGDERLLDELYGEDVVFHSPLARLRGRDAVRDFVAELHGGFPGLRAALHDEFYSADGARGCMRQRLEWRNDGSFRGAEPTGRSGTQVETHSLKIADGRIVEQVAGVSTFQLPKLLLADLGIRFEREVPDPQPQILSASPGDEPADGSTLARRFVDAFGRRDPEALDAVYAEDVELYTPLGWPVRGRDALKAFADEFHASNPGLRITLHDEFYGAGDRACWRIRLHYRNTAPFFGNPATGDTGVMTETHSVTVRDGRIVRQVVGDNTFHMPYQELVLWKMEFPEDTPDPDPELFAARERV